MRPGLSKAHLAVPPALVWSRGNARAMRQRTKHTHSASVEPCGQASAKHTWRYPQRSCGQGATPGPSHREPSTHTAQHSAIVAVITVRPGMNRGPPEGDGPRACARATAPSHTHNSSPGHLYNGPLALTCSLSLCLRVAVMVVAETVVVMEVETETRSDGREEGRPERAGWNRARHRSPATLRAPLVHPTPRYKYAQCDA
jgi:hypothetical protein